MILYFFTFVRTYFFKQNFEFRFALDNRSCTTSVFCHICARLFTKISLVLIERLVAEKNLRSVFELLVSFLCVLIVVWELLGTIFETLGSIFETFGVIFERFGRYLKTSWYQLWNAWIDFWNVLVSFSNVLVAKTKLFRPDTSTPEPHPGSGARAGMPKARSKTSRLQTLSVFLEIFRVFIKSWNFSKAFWFFFGGLYLAFLLLWQRLYIYL